MDSRAPLTDGQLLHSLQQVARSTQTWVVVMSKAGHFAAAVFDLRPRPGKQQGKGEQPLFETLAHKTFHRYVVRYFHAAYRELSHVPATDGLILCCPCTR